MPIGAFMLDPLYVVAGVITGFIVGLTGVGGGALMTPVLLLFFGIPPVTAVATDLWFAAITKVFGALIHHRSGQIDWQVARRLWMGSLPVALIVVVLLSLDIVIAKVEWLTFAIGVLVIVTSGGLIISPQLNQMARNRRVTSPEAFIRVQPLLTSIAGGILGFCVALTSVGAGALGAMALLYLYPLRMNAHRLVGTDIVHAIPLAIVAGIAYLVAGKVDVSMLINLLLGSIPSVMAGAFLAKKISGDRLRMALAITLLLIGIKLII